MVFRLSKFQAKRHAELGEEAERQRAILNQSVSVANGEIVSIMERVNAVRMNLQNVLDRMAKLSEEIASEFRDEFEERGDAWKESDRGQSADEFVSEWEEWACDDLVKFRLPLIEVDPAEVEYRIREFRELPTEAQS